jgi:hypothetical protein
MVQKLKEDGLCAGPTVVLDESCVQMTRAGVSPTVKQVIIFLESSSVTLYR